MKRWIFTITVLLGLAIPALACNLSESPTAVPTAVPAPLLGNPVVGLSPVIGAPGTVIRITAAGFPAGAIVNLFLTGVDATSTTPNPVAQSLSIGANGTLSFAMQLPNEVNGKALSGTIPLNFTVSTTDNLTRASAVFVATTGGTTTATATSASSDGSNGSGDGSGSGGQLFITGPAIGYVIVGNSVVVTGSGAAFNNRVGVQILDAQNKILGSSNATIQAAAGAVGPWQTTLNVAQPSTPTVGYIVAYTISAQGQIGERSSIPVSLAGAAAPTTGPTAAVVTTVAPTVMPIITVAPTTASNPTSPFITATPH